jgi:putative transposase
MSYPLVRDLAAEGIPVRLTCGVLGHSRQAYYAWLASPVSQRDLDDAHLTNALIDAHADDPEFGYRFLADELERAGQLVGERRVWRLCSQQKLWSATVRKGRRGSGKTPGPAVHDDHVRRDFTAPAPDRVWLTDITEHPTAEGKLYCCAIKDLFSNRIIGYAIDERMTAQLAVTALRTAVARRQPTGVGPRAESTGRRNTSSRRCRGGCSDSSAEGAGLPGADPLAGTPNGGVARRPGALLGGHRTGGDD